ncbi:MAG: DMT family transporter [Desulfovibrionaceae bacterium]
MRDETRAWCDLAMAMVIVGSSVVAGKLLVADLPVCFASMLRFALALAVLLPLLYRREGGLPRVRRASWGIFFLQSLCGSFLFTMLLLHGLTMTSAGAAGIITSATPACMGLIAWLALGERPGRDALVGIGLAMAGVAVINLHAVGGADALPGGARPLLGNAMVLGAVVCESLFLLLRKAVPEPVTPLGMATVMSLFGFALFAPFGLREAVALDWGAVPAAGWGAVVYYGLVVTVAAYLFWFRGIVRVGAPVAGVFTGIMPLSALGLSVLVLGEPLSWAAVAGCGCVLAGIWRISGLGGRRKKAPAKAGA